MRHIVILSLAVSALAVASPSGAKALKWGAGPPSLPSGAQMAVVSGNPGAKGRFVIQLKMPADYAVPPHSHPTDEMVKVVSGNLHYGMADKMEMAKAKTLKAGHSVSMAAKMNHWVHAAAPATIQVSGRGPFEINYVDPKDDPRTTK
jgi:quercetin dioxygenase-like cupin family protein